MPKPAAPSRSPGESEQPDESELVDEESSLPPSGRVVTAPPSPPLDEPPSPTSQSTHA